MKKNLIFIVLLISMIQINNVYAYTYDDVTNYKNNNPVPTDCIQWIEKISNTADEYKIIQRCNGNTKIYATDIIWQGGKWQGGGSNNTVWKCDGNPLNHYKSTNWDYYCAEGPQCGVINPTETTKNYYCDGSSISNTVNKYYGNSEIEPCLKSRAIIDNCSTLNQPKASFSPVDQCYNYINKINTACAQNCGDPATVSFIKGVEICGDGIDNDCNGYIDDGGGEEIIDGIDNNCNGEIDELTFGKKCISCLERQNNLPLINQEVGSTVNLASGNLYHNQFLYKSDFEISYNSASNYYGPLGKGWTHNFNIYLKINSPSTVILGNDDGKKITFTLQNGIYKPSPSANDHSTIIKNADGTFKRTAKDGTIYQFNTSGKIISITDRRGDQTAFTYTGNNLTNITLPSTNFASTRNINITYSGNLINQVTTPSQQMFTFVYNSDNTLASIDSADALNNPISWKYEYTNGQMTKKTDPANNITSYTYTDGRLTKSNTPTGEKIITYDPVVANTVKIKEPDLNEWTYIYDSTYDTIVSVTEPGPSGNTITYGYNINGELSSKTEVKNGITYSINYQYSYDTDGNEIITESHAEGVEPNLNTTQNILYYYDAYGQLTQKVIRDLQNSANDIVVSYSYDTKGNLTGYWQGNTLVRRYEYYTTGKPNLHKIIDVKSSTEEFVTEFTYSTDANYDIIIVKGPYDAALTPPAETTEFAYSKTTGNLLSITDPMGVKTLYEYNTLDQLIKIRAQKNAFEYFDTLFTYDALGNIASVTDANGNKLIYETTPGFLIIKDKNNVLIAKYVYGNGGCPFCDGGGRKLTEVYDIKTNPIATYLYDKVGRLTTEKDGLSNQKNYSYDGNIVTRTDANGTVRYTYDALGRLINKKLSDGTVLESFAYNSTGTLVSASNPYIGYSFTYDSNGRLKDVTANGRTIAYLYDALGNRTRMTVTKNQTTEQTVDYLYDAGGRVTSILSNLATTAPFTFTYDAAGRRKTLQHPNGMLSTYAYDTFSGRLTNLSHKTSLNASIDSFDYMYDAVGNWISKGDTQYTYNYTFDHLDMLTNSTPTPTGNGVNIETFAYDLAGNRQTRLGIVEYMHDNDNRLTYFQNANQYTNFTYDSNGNITKYERTFTDGSHKNWIIGYDYENRPISAVRTDIDPAGLSTTAMTVTFKYDPFGRRIEKRAEYPVNGVTNVKVHTYVYDNEDIILEQVDTTINSGSPTSETITYVHGPGVDEPLMMQKGGVNYYYHADALGSITELTDSTQAVVESYRYTSFGVTTKVGNTVNNSFRFTGREFDSEIGVYYYRARYYDPNIGRFISKDPIGIAGGVNLYNYVDGNPVNKVDPTGEFGIIGAFFGAGIELGIQLYENDGNMKDINWKFVGMSAAVGALSPGWLNVGKTTLKSGNAIKVLSSQSTRTAKRTTKILNRIQNHKNQIMNIAITQAVFQSGKAIAKAGNESEQPSTCGD